MKALTRVPGPRPQAQRPRRTEDTGRVLAFRKAAKTILRRAVRLPPIAYAAAFLWDTLDWLNPWQRDNWANTNEMDDAAHPTEQNHLSPHP